MSAFAFLTLDASYNPIPLSADLCFCTNGTPQCVYLLPAVSAVGDTFRIIARDNLWTVQQNAGQQIVMGTSSSTVGAGGSLTANKLTDMVEMICTTANTTFRCNPISGNPTIV